METTRSCRRALLVALGSFGLVVTACGDDDATVATPQIAEDDASTGDDDGAGGGEGASTGSVFPAQISGTLDVEETADIPEGGRAAIGLICGGDGADVFYAGVVDATGAESGTYQATADGVAGPISFTTGSPTAGMGAGASQGEYDAAEYTFDFGELGVQITIEGCGS
jgi:hypothetical protein